MLAQRMISQQDYDAVKARAAVAEAGLREAEAMLSYARIEAPFSGRVTQKLVDIGDLAVPGRPLFTLEEDAAPRFVVNIPESRGGQVSVGQLVQIEVPSIDTIVSGRIVISSRALGRSRADPPRRRTSPVCLHRNASSMALEACDGSGAGISPSVRKNILAASKTSIWLYASVVILCSLTRTLWLGCNAVVTQTTCMNWCRDEIVT
jgi:hypothetical protein